MVNAGKAKMSDAPLKIPVVFYRTAAGTETVLEWLRGLESFDRAVIGQDLMRVQFRWPIGMPLCRPLNDGLWELRSNLARGRIGRVFFCFTNNRLIALHGFIKKTQKTPQAEIDLARRRQREFAQETSV